MFDSSVLRGKPSTLPARPRHRRLDRGRAADGRRRETALLDSRSARLQGTARAEGHARVRRRADLVRASAQRRADVKAAPADAKRTPSGLAYKVMQAGHRRAPSQRQQHGHRPLLRLDDGREDVRQLGHARPADFVRPRRRDQGLDRRRAADGRSARRPASGFRTRSRTKASQAVRKACSCSTSSCSSSSSDLHVRRYSA